MSRQLSRRSISRSALGAGLLSLGACSGSFGPPSSEEPRCLLGSCFNLVVESLTTGAAAGTAGYLVRLDPDGSTNPLDANGSATFSGLRKGREYTLSLDQVSVGCTVEEGSRRTLGLDANDTRILMVKIRFEVTCE